MVRSLGERLDLKHVVRVEKTGPGISEMEIDWRRLQAKRDLGSSPVSVQAGGWTARSPGRCCASLHGAQTSPAAWSRNKDLYPHVSPLGRMLSVPHQDLISVILHQIFSPNASDSPLLILFIFSERGVTRNSRQESESKRTSLGGFSVSTVLCPLLWAELCPFRFICWSLNSQPQDGTLFSTGSCRCNQFR